MLLLVFVNALILKIAFIQSEKWYVLLVITPPLLIAVMYNRHKKPSTLSNPVIKDKMIDKQNTKSLDHIYEQGSNEMWQENLQVLK